MRRLRHLVAVEGRALECPPGSDTSPAFFTICVPQTATHSNTTATNTNTSSSTSPPVSGSWQVVYRSEAVIGTINPSWLPFSIEEDMPVMPASLNNSVHACDDSSRAMGASCIVRIDMYCLKLESAGECSRNSTAALGKPATGAELAALEFPEIKGKRESDRTVGETRLESLSLPESDQKQQGMQQQGGVDEHIKPTGVGIDVIERAPSESSTSAAVLRDDGTFTYPEHHQEDDDASTTSFQPEKGENDAAIGIIPQAAVLLARYDIRLPELTSFGTELGAAPLAPANSVILEFSNREYCLVSSQNCGAAGQPKVHVGECLKSAAVDSDESQMVHKGAGDIYGSEMFQRKPPVAGTYVEARAAGDLSSTSSERQVPARPNGSEAANDEGGDVNGDHTPLEDLKDETKDAGCDREHLSHAADDVLARDDEEEGGGAIAEAIETTAASPFTFTSGDLKTTAVHSAAEQAAPGFGSMLIAKFRRANGTPTEGGLQVGTDNAPSIATPSTTAAIIKSGENDAATLPNMAARPFPVCVLRQHVSSVLALRQRLMQLSVDVEQSRKRIGALLERQLPVRQQHQYVERLALSAAEAIRRKDVLVDRTEKANGLADSNTKTALIASQALVSTLQALVSANRRIADARTSLEGDAGRGRLSIALKELVARRCLMVVQAAAAYKLGPAAVHVATPPPGGLLEAQIAMQWAGAPSVEDTIVVGGGGGSGNGGGVRNTTATSALYRQEVRLTIGGLELHASAWADAFDPGGHAWDAAEARVAAVALGYIAHLVDRFAFYLGVPLRYPIRFRGSTSGVVDNHPPAGGWNAALARQCQQQQLQQRASSLSMQQPSLHAAYGERDGGGGGKSGEMGAVVTPVEYPLYCSSNRERPNFAIGVFLLNKNVLQLLQAHGISAFGPNQLLQNLHKLVAAAQSGLSPGVTSGGVWWR